MSAALMPSDRKFGWTVAILFLLFGAALAVMTMTRAHWLAPAKHAWMQQIADAKHVFLLGAQLIAASLCGKP